VLPDTPATPETLWYGGSTTKAFAAATLAKFIDSGAYPALSNGWQTTISSIIRDDFVLQDAWSTEHLTLEDAVSHRTGMPRHDGSSFHTIDGRTATVKDIVRNLRHLSLTAPPRTKWMYCNMMFVVLTHVIETIRNQWLGDVLKEEIWEPLGMQGTYLKLEDAERAPQPLAEGYFWDEEKEEYVLIPNMHMNEIGGAGAIFSNVVDYAKWVKCLMHSCDVFSSQAHQAIRSPIMLMAGPNGPRDLTLYGLAWMRTTYYGHVAYEHSGGTDAFSTNVLWFPELKYSVVAFGNTATTAYGAEKVLTHKLLDDKLGIPESDRYDYAAEYVTSQAAADGRTHELTVAIVG
jgi:CubicO group peptidase (beta-lactamase class C family)